MPILCRIERRVLTNEQRVMNPKSLHLIEQQFGLVHDCMRACVYGDYIERVAPKDEAWMSIRDMCYSDAIISWSSIFGVYSEETHWKKLVEQFECPKGERLRVFSSSSIEAYLGISHDEWQEFWKKVIDVRNHRIAHTVVSYRIEDLPNVTWLLSSSYIYREWLIELLKLGKRLGHDIKVTEQSSRWVIDNFKRQIREALKYY